jgi:hypothetical protein
MKKRKGERKRIISTWIQVIDRRRGWRIIFPTPSSFLKDVVLDSDMVSKNNFDFLFL